MRGAKEGAAARAKGADLYASLQQLYGAGLHLKEAQPALDAALLFGVGCALEDVPASEALAEHQRELSCSQRGRTEGRSLSAYAGPI